LRGCEANHQNLDQLKGDHEHACDTCCYCPKPRTHMHSDQGDERYAATERAKRQRQDGVVVVREER
jgi:hypothetical protein